jgi:hypothetical protein
MSIRRRKPSIKKPAPDTPPAQTALQAIDNLTVLLEIRNAGWDRIAVRDIIHVAYGSTEEFVKQHMPRLRHMAGKSVTQ